MMDRWVDSGSKFHHVPLSLGIKTTQNLNSLKKKEWDTQYVQCLIITYNRKESEKEYIYTHIYMYM